MVMGVLATDENLKAPDNFKIMDYALDMIRILPAMFTNRLKANTEDRHHLMAAYYKGSLSKGLCWQGLESTGSHLF